MYRADELSLIIKQMERKYKSGNEDRIKEIAEKELIAWNIICDNLARISYSVLKGEAAHNIADFNNYCEGYRTKLRLIVEPSPYVERCSISELLGDMGAGLNHYEERVKYILKNFKDEFELVKKEFKPLLEPEYFGKLA